MVSVLQHGVYRIVETPGRLIYKSAPDFDTVILACVLFLQRFYLGSSGISLDLFSVGLLFTYQFVSGRLLIQYDRLMWFLALGLAVTASLLLNFRSTMLVSYVVFMTLYFLFTLSRPSTRDRYKRTLQGFQFLVLVLSCLAIGQFLAQFVVDGRQIIRFFGIIPDFLLPPEFTWGEDRRVSWNTIIPITEGSSLIKSNGIFLIEPSTMSQMAALGILIEVLEFHRPRYLILFGFGLLLSYSGTGLTILFLCLPLTGIVNRRAQIPALLAAILILALLTSDIIDASAFTSRIGEFEDVNASGFGRFISSFWMAAQHLDAASPPVLLRGNGPATMKEFVPDTYYLATGATWFKLIYEYGLIGAFLFSCFLCACFRGSRCPKVVIAALMYYYIFTGDGLLSTGILTIMVVLCTLSGPEPGRDHIERTAEPPSTLAPTAR
jgi:hypothetical protein